MTEQQIESERLVAVERRLRRERLEGVAAAIERGVPFSLACTRCDGGQEIENYEAAVAAGWEGITADDGLSWNFLGDCPGCIAAEQGVMF